MFDERNRYSFSGSDVSAFAFYSMPKVRDADALLLKALRLRLEELDSSIVTAAGSQMVVQSVHEEGTVSHSGEPGFDLTSASDEYSLVSNEIQRLEEKIRAGSPVHLESLATISLSIHEPKGQARALGHRGIKGFSRSVRTIAGTMILLLVEDHPLRALAYQRQSLIDQNDSAYSLDLNSKGQGGYRNPGTLTTYPGNTRLSTLLNKFNVILRYRSEVLPASPVTFTTPARNAEGLNERLDAFNTAHNAVRDSDSVEIRQGQQDVSRTVGLDRHGAARRDRREYAADPYSGVQGVEFKVPKVATMMIEGMEIISEGITTSVNDMVTEVVIQFIAEDVKQLSTLHESSIASYRPDELPADIYQQLKGAVSNDLSVNNEQAEVLEGMKSREQALKDSIQTKRAHRRAARAVTSSPPAIDSYAAKTHRDPRHLGRSYDPE